MDPRPDAAPPGRVAAKLWTRPLGPGASAALHAADGSIRFVLGDGVDQYGLWFNADGWTGIGGAPYYNLALEPCIGAQDTLFDAVEVERLAPTLPGNGFATWSLTVTLEASPEHAEA